MSLEAMKLAAEFNRYFTSANGVDVRAKVSVTRDEWRVLFTAILAKQPATPEPVAWIRRHPNGALSNEMLTHVQVEQVRRDSGAWVPLYTHPAPSVPGEPVVEPFVATYSSESIGGKQHDTGRVNKGPRGGFFASTASVEDASLIADALNAYTRPAPSVPDGHMRVKTEDMVRLVNLIGPAPVEHGGKTFTFNMPNPEENLRLISATVRCMLAAK